MSAQHRNTLSAQSETLPVCKHFTKSGTGDLSFVVERALPAPSLCWSANACKHALTSSAPAITYSETAGTGLTTMFDDSIDVQSISKEDVAKRAEAELEQHTQAISLAAAIAAAATAAGEPTPPARAEVGCIWRTWTCSVNTNAYA